MASLWVAQLASHDSAGTLYINTLGVKMDPASGDGLNASDLASAVNDWIGSSYRDLLRSSLTFDTITVRKQPEPTTDEGVHAIALAGTATDSTVLPKELAVTLAWKTDHPGRSGRGHIALPCPWLNGIISDGNSYLMTSTYFTTKVAAFFSALDGGHGWGPGGADGHISHVVYSRKDATGYDVKTRLARSAPRWQERRQTAP